MCEKHTLTSTSCLSLYLRNKQMESESEQTRGETREGEGPSGYLPCREACLPLVFVKKDISLWEQPFGSHQAVVTGKYIRPDLVCFGCFGDAAIMRDRGLVTERGQFSFPLSQPPSALFLPLFRSHTTCISVFPSSNLTLSYVGVKIFQLFFHKLSLFQNVTMERFIPLLGKLCCFELCRLKCNNKKSYKQMT